MHNIMLAPMCGITDSIFRTLCYEMGCETAFTEMVSAMGYLCAPDQRATQELIFRGSEEPKLILQLFGRDPDTVAEAAKRLCALNRFDGIDLNMGCPAKKIAPSGEGCGLMRTPETARRMMEKTVKAANVPVSVKLRLGYDDHHINVLEYARMAENSGISFITIHGRTREQQYSGLADWDTIAGIKAKVHIPVIGNGDLFTAETAVRKMRESGVDGIMIGRGAMGNPWIFRDISNLLSGKGTVKVTPQEKCALLIRHYRMMLDQKPEHIAVREMRKHIGWYIRGTNGASRFRNTINSCDDAEQVIQMVRCFFDGEKVDTPNERGEFKA